MTPQLQLPRPLLLPAVTTSHTCRYVTGGDRGVRGSFAWCATLCGCHAIRTYVRRQPTPYRQIACGLTRTSPAYQTAHAGGRPGARPTAQPRARAHTRPQNPFQGSTDWAHVRNRYAYQRPRATSWYAFWSEGLRREQARAVHARSQMLLLLGTLAAIWAVDSVSTSLWQANNHGVRTMASHCAESAVLPQSQVGSADPRSEHRGCSAER